MQSIFERSGVKTRRRVAVIGGGLSGLTAAFRCARAGDSVTVFEASSRFGGSIRSERSGGFIVEHGAEAFPANSAAVRELAAELGIARDLREQRVARAFEFDGSALLALEAGEAAARLGLKGRSSSGAGVATFRLGLQQLSDALVARLRQHAELRSHSPVSSVKPCAGGWRLAADGSLRLFDAVIIAGTARLAAELLSDSFGSAAKELLHSPRIASLTISLAYSEQSLPHPLDGTGFVTRAGVPLEGCVACTFSSSKFGGRAARGSKLLRLFFRPTPEDLALPSSALAARALSVMRRVFPRSGSPRRLWEARWPAGFPLIDEGHERRVLRLEQALEGHAVALAGSAFHGSGIDAAVRSAAAAALKLHSLSASPHLAITAN